MTFLYSPVRFALIGGGPGSFIGGVHKMAAELDGKLKLVAGIFSRDVAKSKSAGVGYGVAPDRIYTDMKALTAGEGGREDGAELVVVATPNASHFEIASAALKGRFHVMSEKPATATLSEARSLEQIVSEASSFYGITYTYSGYSLLREARERIHAGALGPIRKVTVEYSQGWLSAAVERDAANHGARWRTDPAQAGLGGAIGDIGVHAFHAAEFVSGLRVRELFADLGHVVAGRALDDDCTVPLRFDNGVRGLLQVSQVATGDRNGLRLRIWGERGGLDWSHETSEILAFHWPDRPSEILHAGASYLGETARHSRRLPSGHPEGFIEAFATLYSDFADAIRTNVKSPQVPDMQDGMRGLLFVTRVAENAGKWVRLD